MEHAVAGCCAAMVAEVCTMPIDTTKVRLQLKQESFGRAIPTAIDMAKREGVRSLFRGVTPALVRQGLTSGLIFGAFNGSKIKRDTFAQKLVVGGFFGAFSVGMINPVDVVKVRMQSGAYAYRGLWHGLTSVWTKEGWNGVLAGVSPAMQRACVVNAVELAVYDQAKCYITDSTTLPPLASHFLASLCAGLGSVATANPLDMAKSRLMSMQGKKSLFSCLVDTVRNEGVLALYKGAFPNWLRKGPHCAIQFVLYEQFRARLTEWKELREAKLAESDVLVA